MESPKKSDSQSIPIPTFVVVIGAVFVAGLCALPFLANEGYPTTHAKSQTKRSKSKRQ